MGEEGQTHEASGEPLLPSWDHIGSDQLRLYAREFAEHYHKERELHRQVEARNKDLELRVRELSALNAMFQQHLDRRKLLEDSLRRLADAIAGISEQANHLLREFERSRPGEGATPTMEPHPRPGE